MPLLDIMQKKLREAHYFLGLMNAVDERTVGNPEEFQFLLSAFLSASRSITDLLENRQYRSWFEAWQNGRENRAKQLLQFMRIQRIAEVHSSGADILQDVQYIPISEIRSDSLGHPVYYGFQWWAPPGTSSPTIGVTVREFKLGSTKVGALATCRDIVYELSELVRAFETTCP